eukprot:307574-Prorocentrum_minimum.AAC.1
MVRPVRGELVWARLSLATTLVLSVTVVTRIVDLTETALEDPCWLEYATDTSSAERPTCALGDQSAERKEYIPGEGTNRLRGKSVHLERGPIN